MFIKKIFKNISDVSFVTFTTIRQMARLRWCNGMFWVFCLWGSINFPLASYWDSMPVIGWFSNLDHDPGSPHLGNPGRQDQLLHLRWVHLWGSIWHHRSDGQARNSARSGWRLERSPFVETLWSCHTCRCLISGRRWHDGFLEQSYQTIHQTEGSYLILLLFWYIDSIYIYIYIYIYSTKFSSNIYLFELYFSQLTYFNSFD